MQNKVERSEALIFMAAYNISLVLETIEPGLIFTREAYVGLSNSYEILEIYFSEVFGKSIDIDNFRYGPWRKKLGETLNAKGN